MIKPSVKEELLDYLTETISLLKKVEALAQSKNKTVKIKGILSTIQIVMARLSSSHSYIKSGGYEMFPITMQKSLYDPIIEWLIGEVE